MSEQTVRDNLLITKADYLNQKLEINIESSINEIDNTLIIKAIVIDTNVDLDVNKFQYKLIVECKSMRFSHTFPHTTEKNGELANKPLFNAEIPLAYLSREVRSYVAEVIDSGIHRRSDDFIVEIDDELIYDIPEVGWESFSTEFPDIKDLFWYMTKDDAGDINIYFNTDIKLFSIGLRAKKHSEFRRLFRSNFMQAFNNILILDIDALSDTRLNQELLNNLPFQGNLITNLLDFKFEKDEVWKRFAILNQYLNNANYYLKKILKEMERDMLK